jgi:hypothetical protein
MCKLTPVTVVPFLLALVKSIERVCNSNIILNYDWLSHLKSPSIDATEVSRSYVRITCEDLHLNNDNDNHSHGVTLFFPLHDLL